jgi:hypothetical protein
LCPIAQQVANSLFFGLPVADVLTLASGDCLIKQPNDVIAREVEVTHRLRRGLVVTGDDCVAIETDEVRPRLRLRNSQVGRSSICREPAENEFSDLCYTFEYRCQNGTRPALDMGLTKGRLEVEQVE